MTNMGGRQIAIDLSSVAAELNATTLSQTRLNYHKGEVVFEPEHTVDVTAIPVDVNETTVIRLNLPMPLKPEKSLRLGRHYALKTAVANSGKPAAFKVNAPQVDSIESAKLIVGVHRRGGLTEPLIADINGTRITIDTGDANEFTEFFDPLDADVPVSYLRGKNDVLIEGQDGATITSVQLRTLSK